LSAAAFEPEPGLDLPPDWVRLPVESLRGVLLVIGAPNVGKSTFSRYLFRRLAAAGVPCAYLDGDPGQSSLGPPATLTLACAGAGEGRFPPPGPYLRRFVGAVSPSGRPTAVLSGTFRLARAAQERGAACVVVDTSGFVDPGRGGSELKLAKMDLLEPSAVFALQQEDELAGLLRPLRKSRRFQVTRLRASPAARSRGTAARRAHRAAAFARYFEGSRRLELPWQEFAVFPTARFVPGLLVGLDDARGFTLGLGIVLQVDVPGRRLTLLTPLPTLDGVDSIHLGSLLLDPETFHDRPL